MNLHDFTEKSIISIVPICAEQLGEALEVIHRAFATVADDFGLTRENCPKHTGFIPIERLQNQMNWGWQMFVLLTGEKIVGYASLSKEDENTYELHNLAVLPECRHNGYGRMLLDHIKEKVRKLGGQRITIGIIEENSLLKNWYSENGFKHTGTKKFEHLPFTTGFMEWRDEE
mgnify:FL=1